MIVHPRYMDIVLRAPIHTLAWFEHNTSFDRVYTTAMLSAVYALDPPVYQRWSRALLRQALDWIDLKDPQGELGKHSMDIETDPYWIVREHIGNMHPHTVVYRYNNVEFTAFSLVHALQSDDPTAISIIDQLFDVCVGMVGRAELAKRGACAIENRWDMTYVYA